MKTLTACLRAARPPKSTLHLSPTTCRAQLSKREATFSPKNNSTAAQKLQCTNLSEPKRLYVFTVQPNFFAYFLFNLKAFPQKQALRLRRKSALPLQALQGGDMWEQFLCSCHRGLCRMGKSLPQR